MRHLHLPTIFLSSIPFSDLAFTFSKIIVARQLCESEWCLPSLPWDPIEGLVGAGAAAVGDFINSFVKPQSGANEKDSDARLWTNTNIELDVNPQVEEDQDQCRTIYKLLGQVSLLLCKGHTSNMECLSNNNYIRDKPMLKDAGPRQNKSFGRSAAN